MSDNTKSDPARTLREDTHDTLDEAKNRVVAGTEHAKRDIAGDSMSLGDRIKSGLNEAKHNVAAEFDKAKRDVRHDGEDR